MTITYPNGTVLQAIVLSHDENEIRAIAPGGDVLAFTHLRETWISEDLEPVAIEFGWQRRAATPALSLEDCVCSKELAAHLIRILFAGDELQESPSDESSVFAPNVTRAAAACSDQAS